MSAQVMRWRQAAIQASAIALEKTGVEVPVALILAVIEAESSGNPAVVSKAGAIGLMQLLPRTARWLGVDPGIPERNILGGTIYLAKHLKRFYKLNLALAAYNAGPGNVNKYRGVPPFKETQDYIIKVMGLIGKYNKQLKTTS